MEWESARVQTERLVCGPAYARAMRAQAVALDRQAVGLLRGEGALDLALGRLLLALDREDRLLKLGFARLVDYAREFPGVSWSTVSGWLRLARGLATRPLLRRAVVAGLVSPRKARLVFGVAHGDAEAAWAFRASRLTEDRLRAALAAQGSAPSDEPAAFETLVAELDEEQRRRLELGLSAAEGIDGIGPTRWRRYEAMALEYLSSHGDVLAAWDDAQAATAPRSPDRECGPALDPAEKRRLGALVERELAALAEAGLLVAEPQEGGEPLPADAFELHERAMRLFAARRNRELALGVVLFELSASCHWERLGFPTRERYCRERLGISPRTMRHKAGLEWDLRGLPALRAALEQGRLNFTQARLIARRATPFDVEHRIEQAAATTVQELQDEDLEERERQIRDAGLVEVRAPEDVLPLILDAIACAKLVAAHHGERIGDGEALARIAQHFWGVWRHHGRKRISRKRRAILERQKHQCAVPGCGAPIQHLHHVVPRSRGGSDDPGNQIGLCAFHHLRGVHGGLLRVVGAAGERLEWTFAGTGAEWMTIGGWRVRRAGT